MNDQAFGTTVTMPPGAQRTGIVQVVELETTAHAWEISPGVIVHGYAFNGQVPGPTIEAAQGDTLAVRFTNHLPEAVRIHWLGLPLGPKPRGGMSPGEPVPSGASREYEIVLSAAGAFCYYIPATTVGPGLHGVVIVRPQAGSSPDGERWLVITAVRVGRSAVRQPGGRRRLAGAEVLLADGALQPHLTVKAGHAERWRLMNLTGHELRLSVAGGWTLLNSAGQDRPEAAADCLLLAAWGWTDAVLGPVGAGEAVRLRASGPGPGSGIPPHYRVATLHGTP